MSNLLQLNDERPAAAASAYDANYPQEPDPELLVRVKRGANWFYWIAALSMINSIAFTLGAQFHFLAGLGVTEIADAVIDVSIKQGVSPAIRGVSIVFDLVVVIAFALAGYFASKRFTAVFVVGIIVYVFDSLIVLLLGDFFMVAFHALALFYIVRGFLACRGANAFDRANAAVVPTENIPPPPPAFT